MFFLGTTTFHFLYSKFSISRVPLYFMVAQMLDCTQLAKQYSRDQTTEMEETYIRMKRYMSLKFNPAPYSQIHERISKF